MHIIAPQGIANGLSPWFQNSLGMYSGVPCKLIREFAESQPLRRRYSFSCVVCSDHSFFANYPRGS